MYFLKFLLLILPLNQLNTVLAIKKPIINETKILENIENYNRLLKQYLSSIQKTEKEVNQKLISKSIIYPKTDKSPKLLVIALDGFRYDYVNLYNARTFKKLQTRGVYAQEGLISMFCTKTFPNFFSLSTGLYQQSHGIIDNHFRDLKLNKTFDIYSMQTNKEKFWFDIGEPIWLTAVKQGKKVGSCQFPATDTFVENLNEFLPFDPSLNLSSRLDLAYDWLYKKDLDLVLTYYHQPDDTGHYFGPFSLNVQQEINIIDNELSKFIERVDASNGLDPPNILIISDHGMSFAKDLSYKIFLSDYIDLRNVEVINEGAIVQVNANKEHLNEIFKKLKYSNQRFKVYRKDELPKRFHYGYLDRLFPLILMAEEGYQIFKDRESRPFYVGNHGWDNELYSMRPLFYGYGPNLKKNFNVKAFETINLYNLMCRLLNLIPAPNNGTMEIVESLLN